MNIYDFTSHNEIFMNIPMGEISYSDACEIKNIYDSGYNLLQEFPQKFVTGGVVDTDGGVCILPKYSKYLDIYVYNILSDKASSAVYMSTSTGIKDNKKKMVLDSYGLSRWIDKNEISNNVSIVDRIPESKNGLITWDVHIMSHKIPSFDTDVIYVPRKLVGVVFKYITYQVVMFDIINTPNYMFISFNEWTK